MVSTAESVKSKHLGRKGVNTKLLKNNELAEVEIETSEGKTILFKSFIEG